MRFNAPADVKMSKDDDNVLFGKILAKICPKNIAKIQVHRCANLSNKTNHPLSLCQTPQQHYM